MRAYVEVLNALQITINQEIIPYRPSSNRRNFEDWGKVLAVSVSEIYQGIAVQLYQPMCNKWLSLLHVFK